jgi:hypothetical protein
VNVGEASHFVESYNQYFGSLNGVVIVEEVAITREPISICVDVLVSVAPV